MKALSGVATLVLTSIRKKSKKKNIREASPENVPMHPKEKCFQKERANSFPFIEPNAILLKLSPLLKWQGKTCGMSVHFSLSSPTSNLFSQQ